MSALVDLSIYKTKSDTQLVDKHNQLVDAVISNFNYTLTQVSDPIPATATGYVNDILAIRPGSVLGYVNPNTIVTFDGVFNEFNKAGDSVLTLKNNLYFNLFGSSGNGVYSLRAVSSGGTPVDYVSFAQTSQSGDLTETHQVNQYSLTADSASVTVTSGYLSVNALQVSGYTLPTTAPSAGQVLKAASSSALEFQTVQEHVLSSATDYSLAEVKPFRFAFTSYPALSLAFGSSLTTGFGYAKNISGYVGTAVAYFRVADKDLAYMVPGSKAPYLALRGGLVLPETALMDPSSNPIGSIWYEGSQDSLVVVTGTGKKYISAQAISKAVNTEESKDFSLQPASTLSVAAGTEAKPSLNIGNAGLTSTDAELKVVVGGSPALAISPYELKSADPTATASARIALGGSGVNNPSTPTYGFSQASGLGLYRSGTNSMAVSAKGVPVVEFSEGVVNAKGSTIANVKTPTEPADAANKQYIDSKIPAGVTPGALPILDPTYGGRYVESSAKYSGGVLEVGTSTQPGGFKVNSALGGSCTIKAPATNNSVVFELPANSLSGGILQSVNNKTYWVSTSSITAGTLKADGSADITGNLRASVDTTPAKPLLGKDGTGMYARTDTVPRIGFAANGSRLMEVDGQAGVLKGRTDVYNAPFIRLNNTVGSYSSTISGPGTPTYSFAGDSMTGIGQKRAQSITLMVSGAAKLSATSDGVDAHFGRVKGVADPVVESDAANKKYVDSQVKPRKELSFRITSLPAGWSTGNSIILSVYDKSLIYQSAYAEMVYESSSDNKKVAVPSNFNLNPDCQVYIDNTRLVKMASSSGVRQATFASSTSILLNYGLNIGSIITVHLPG